jgi:adenine-specific DNA-methyltransferase
MNDRDRLISLLKELFRFDKAELDFGIYRIMNQRKDEIEKFIALCVRIVVVRHKI